MAVDKTEQQNSKPLVRAHARNLRISPRKMRLVTNLVKNMRVNDALVQLQFTNKKAAGMVSKLLQSALANAENNFSLNREGMFIKTITCDMGPVLQRAFPRARGSAFVIRRKMSHVNVVLEEREVKVKKTAPKLAKVKKADKPVKTQEGSLGLPVEETKKSKPKDKAVKEVHRENEDKLVEEKTSPQVLQK
jgi:large subunit ribosomal protein L22